MILARISPRAMRDIGEVFDRIAANDPQAARRVREAILDTADLLASNPELGTLVRHAARRHEKIRWFVLPRFRSYLLFYMPFEETIAVVRVLHAARDWTRFFPKKS